MTGNPVLIVGAGLTGLACARTLREAGRDFEVLESSPRIGGRLGSTVVSGVVCDLGFQVSMSNYGSLESLVPREIAPRHQFIPGAIVVTDHARIRVVDPGREPLSGIAAWWKGLAKIKDLRAALRTRRHAARVFAGGHEPGTGSSFLQAVGFSDGFRESFLRPFFGGVMLDESLDVPADRFLRTLHRFATGVAELPAGGMQSLADALAEPILSDIHLDTSVAEIASGSITLADGRILRSEEIVVATPFDTTNRLLGGPETSRESDWSGTTAVHFASSERVIDEAIIVLNGRPGGDVNLACSPSEVAPGVAPPGTHSVLVSLRPGPRDPSNIDLDSVRHEAGELLGVDSSRWTHLITTHVPHALPRPGAVPGIQPPDGVRLAGDWQADPSIDNAIRIGIDTAHAIIAA